MINKARVTKVYDAISRVCEVFCLPIAIVLLAATAWVTFVAKITAIANPIYLINAVCMAVLFFTVISIPFSKKEGERKEEDKLFSVLGFTVIGIFALWGWIQSGETAKPMTNISEIYINQELDFDNIERLGLVKIDNLSYRGYYVYHDPSVPEANYYIYTDYLTNIVYRIKVKIKTPTSDDAEVLRRNTIETFDSAYGGGNKGFPVRFYGDIKLKLGTRFDTVTIEMADTKEKERIEKRQQKLFDNKVMQAFHHISSSEAFVSKT